MGNNTQSIPNTRQVLLVASPNDTHISELIMTALLASGVHVRMATTVVEAAQADAFALCILILRPGQWRTTPTITTAMRCNPRFMIPILAEPMPLPAGAWSTEPILLEEPLSETIQAVELLIRKQLEATTLATQQSQKQPTTSEFRPQNASSTFRTVSSHKNRARLNSLGRYGLIGLILILLVGLLAYYGLGKHSPAGKFIDTQPGAATTTFSAFARSNIVSVPGPGCNTNTTDWWGVGSRFKTTGTPTTTTSSPNETPTPAVTPTPHVVIDNSTVVTCQQDGLSVKHTNHYDAFAMVFFQDGAQSQNALPQHFSTQVTATALNPSADATFILGVRQQNSDAITDDSGYGDDNLLVGSDGSWQTARTNDKTDQYDPPFTQGYVKPATTMTLGAEVEGPRITFSINGQKVTTIVDTTFPSGYAIGFGLSDSGTKSPPSALYSNFSYQPLPTTKLTTQFALATATAQATANLQTPYRAAIPGPGCDQGSGQWQPVTKVRNYGTATCQAHGLAISQDATARYTGYASFFGLDGNLPTNYKVQVHIDMSQLGNGCAGMATRTDTRAAGYSFMICSNGYWRIERYPSKGGDGYLLDEGNVASQTAYTLLATSNRDVQSLSLDGVTVSTIHDTTLRTTDHIELTMYAGQGKPGTALFSNFVFTPLS